MAVSLRVNRSIPYSKVLLLSGITVISFIIAQFIVHQLYLILAGFIIFLICLAIGIYNWKWSFYGLLVYLPFTGVAILAMYPNTGPPNLFKDFLFVIPAYVGFLLSCLVKRQKYIFPPEAPKFLLIALASLVIFHAFNPSLPSRLVGFIGIRVWLLYIPLYFLTYHLIDSKERIIKIIELIFWVGMIPITIGVLEAILIYTGHGHIVYSCYGEAAWAATQGFAETVYPSGGRLVRIPSTFSFSAQYYGFTNAMVVVGYIVWSIKKNRREHYWLYTIMIALILIANFTNGSRGSFITVPVLLILLALLTGGGKATWYTLPYIIIGGMTFSLVVQSILKASIKDVIAVALGLTRQYTHTTFWEEFTHSFSITLTGLGAGIDSTARRYAGVEFSLPWFESWWTKVVLELGVPGLVTVIALFGTILIRGFKNHFRIRDIELKVISAACLGYIIWVLLYMTKDQRYDMDPTNVYFWVFAGILAAIPKLSKTL